MQMYVLAVWFRSFALKEEKKRLSFSTERLREAMQTCGFDSSWDSSSRGTSCSAAEVQAAAGASATFRPRGIITALFICQRTPSKYICLGLILVEQRGQFCRIEIFWKGLDSGRQQVGVNSLNNTTLSCPQQKTPQTFPARDLSQWRDEVWFFCCDWPDFNDQCN